jgi:hypothetical protein
MSIHKPEIEILLITHISENHDHSATDSGRLSTAKSHAQQASKSEVRHLPEAP